MNGYYIDLDIFGPLSRRQEVVSAFIGYRGSNISYIRKLFNYNIYIKVYNSKKGLHYKSKGYKCDKIYIYSQQKNILLQAYKKIYSIIHDILNYKYVSPYQSIINIDKQAVGYIIGKNGSELKHIIKNSGIGTYIIYKHTLNAFVITAKNIQNLNLAKSLLKHKLTEYYQQKKIWYHKHKHKHKHNHE